MNRKQHDQKVHIVILNNSIQNKSNKNNANPIKKYINHGNKNPYSKNNNNNRNNKNNNNLNDTGHIKKVKTRVICNTISHVSKVVSRNCNEEIPVLYFQ